MRRRVRNPSGFAQSSVEQRNRLHSRYQDQEFGVSDAVSRHSKPNADDCEQCRAANTAVSAK
ncbi:MAG: hypothetical protein WBP12_01600 [Candidatus Saccharimonas sp.]